MTFFEKKLFFLIYLFIFLDLIWDRLGYEKPSSGSGLRSFNNGLVMFYDLKSNFHVILFLFSLNKNWPKICKKHKMLKNRKLRSRCLTLSLCCQKWIKYTLIVFLRCWYDWVLKKSIFSFFFQKSIFGLFSLLNSSS